MAVSCDWRPWYLASLQLAAGVFAGDMDKHAHAFDADSGKILWQTQLPGAPGGGVISYLVDGRQRVAFVAGTRTTVLPVSRASAKIAMFGL